MRRLVPLVVAAAAAALPVTAAHATSPCIPSVTGYGPSVYVRPDYSDPTKSQVGYDTSDFGVFFDLCLH